MNMMQNNLVLMYMFVFTDLNPLSYAKKRSPQLFLSFSVTCPHRYTPTHTQSLSVSHTHTHTFSLSHSHILSLSCFPPIPPPPPSLFSSLSLLPLPSLPHSLSLLSKKSKCKRVKKRQGSVSPTNFKTDRNHRAACLGAHRGLFSFLVVQSPSSMHCISRVS